MEEYNSKMENYGRNEVRVLLEKCTKEQQAFFKRIFKSVDEITPGKIKIAYDLCVRTINKNLERLSIDQG